MAPLASIQEVFQAMPSRFQPEKAGDLKAVIQFNLTGEGGGQYTVSIADGACSVAEGVAPSPNMTLTATAADYLSMLNGETNPMQAFMQGKIQVKGDVSLALKMQSIFLS
jgi:putative sterol carrier protein